MHHGESLSTTIVDYSRMVIYSRLSHKEQKNIMLGIKTQVQENGSG